jgi:glutathione transport system permease protein
VIVLRLLGRAALRILPVLAGVSVLAFALVHLSPGDPAVVAAGLEASPATVERIRRDLGLDRSLPRQFADFAARVVRGDLGVSIRTGRPVGAEIAERLGYKLADEAVHRDDLVLAQASTVTPAQVTAR